MQKFVKVEKAFWAVSMLACVSLMGAEARVAARRSAPIERQIAPSAAPVAVAVQASQTSIAQPPAVHAQQVDNTTDKRLVANLLVDSIVMIESAGNPRTVGRHGERGLMQIKAGTWSDTTRNLFGSKVSFDRAFEPNLNRQVGAAYLAELQAFLARHRRLWKADERSLLLACYNAGPERVMRSGFDLRRVPARTRDYVLRGTALHDSMLADRNVSVPGIRLAMASPDYRPSI